MSIEIHRAIVSRNDDPKKQGRIRVKCQTLAGADVELPQWIKPLPFFTSHGLKSGEGAGWFGVPEVKSEVEIEVNVSSPDDETAYETFISAPDMHYRCVLYSAASPLPEEFKTNYPNRRGLRTPSGHLLIFDDKKDEELIEMRHKDGKSFWQFKIVSSAVKFISDCAKYYIGESATEIILGKDSDAKFLAYAENTKNELNELHNKLDTLVTKYNGHKHTVTGIQTAGAPTAHTQTAPVDTMATTDTGTAPAAVGDIATTVVKGK